jgi:hypothetical protein
LKLVGREFESPLWCVLNDIDGGVIVPPSLSLKNLPPHMYLCSGTVSAYEEEFLPFVWVLSSMVTK